MVFDSITKYPLVVLQIPSLPITHLNLNRTSISDKSILLICQSHIATHLKSLHVAETQITDLTVHYLRNGKLTQLQVLNVSNNVRISDTWLPALLKELLTLQELHVKDTMIGDATVQAALHNAPQLRILRMQRCASISHAAFAHYNALQVAAQFSSIKICRHLKVADTFICTTLLHVSPYDDNVWRVLCGGNVVVIDLVQLFMFIKQQQQY